MVRRKFDGTIKFPQHPTQSQWGGHAGFAIDPREFSEVAKKSEVRGR